MSPSESPRWGYKPEAGHLAFVGFRAIDGDYLERGKRHRGFVMCNDRVSRYGDNRVADMLVSMWVDEFLEFAKKNTEHNQGFPRRVYTVKDTKPDGEYDITVQMATGGGYLYVSMYADKKEE